MLSLLFGLGMRCTRSKLLNKKTQFVMQVFIHLTLFDFISHRFAMTFGILSILKSLYHAILQFCNATFFNVLRNALHFI